MTVPDALIAVGRDCDCGHPLVWRDGHEWCAVYGSHPPPAPVVYLRPASVVLADIERRRGDVRTGDEQSPNPRTA